MNKFWELFRESIIVQSLLSLILVGTTCYMYISGSDVPDTLLALTGTALGFFFRAKNEQQVRQLASTLTRNSKEPQQ